MNPVFIFTDSHFFNELTRELNNLRDSSFWLRPIQYINGNLWRRANLKSVFAAGAMRQLCPDHIWSIIATPMLNRNLTFVTTYGCFRDFAGEEFWLFGQHAVKETYTEVLEVELCQHCGVEHAMGSRWRTALGLPWYLLSILHGIPLPNYLGCLSLS